MNAFADHFLEDSFSSGHLRTPRRQLHWDEKVWDQLPVPDLCAKVIHSSPERYQLHQGRVKLTTAPWQYMHDEDCAIGLSVENPKGETWTAYGDKKALDQANVDNKNRCIAAVQASADEIFQAFTSKTVPAEADYKAWAYAPTLASATGPQALVPLFKSGTVRRVDIKNRRLSEFTNSFWFPTTAALCAFSHWWDYPITIDGPIQLLTPSPLAATDTSPLYCRVFFQTAAGAIRQSSSANGVWTLDSSTLFTAKLNTPLAALNYNNGKEVNFQCLYC